MSTAPTLADHTACAGPSPPSRGSAVPGSRDLPRRDSVRDDVSELLAAIASELSNGGAGEMSVERQVLVDFEIGAFRYVLMRQHVVATTHLSPRELEIVRLVADGLPNKTIGAILDISAWTVATHLRRIFAKLGVTSRSAMVARAVEQAGRFQPPPLR